jgi:uncharacterized protein
MLAHNIAALLKSPPGTNREVAIDEPDPNFGDEIVVRTPVVGVARLHRTQQGILVQCEVSTTVELECSRCLEPFAYPVSVRFAEEFLPTVNVTTGAPVESAEDEALRIDEHHVLDLTEAVRQYLLTEIPLKPVCQPDCAGLCPVCGKELNNGSCTCEVDTPDASSPFAALQALLVQNEPSRPDGN